MRRPELREAGRAALVYALAAVVYTWPLLPQLRSHLAAPVGPGDPFLNLWILGWGMQAILGAPLDVLRGRVFNANIFHPAESTLAYSDHLLPQSAALAPLFALTGDVVLCYNLLFLLSLALSGLAMHAFVRGVTGSTGGAYLAGLVWAFSPYHFAHQIHIQLQALYFLPLAFLFLHRLMAGRRTRDAVALGVVAALQAWSSVYYAVIGAVGLAAAALTLAFAIGRWRSSLIARRLVIAAVVGGVLVLPIAWVYGRVQQDEGFGRGLYQASRNAAAPGSYLQVPAENVVYGRTNLLPHGMLEQVLFPGFVPLTLAMLAFVRGRRSDARPLVLTMGVVAAIGFVLSLGPDGIRDVYAWFQRAVYGFSAIRAPARFGVLVLLGVAALAALGYRDLRPRWRHAAIVLAAVELLNVPMPLAAAPARRTDVGQWLASAPGGGAVVHLPIGLDVESTPAMVQSLEHRRPLVNGYSGQRPPFYTALVDSLSTFPSDESLLALNELGVRFVVTSTPVPDEPAAQPSPLVERARFSDGVIYELHWTPEIESRLAAESAVIPDAPGTPPFGPGEVARYHAFWAGGGMNVPAGEITIAVEQRETQDGLTFVARGVTAPWMARFFEARDTFTTEVDAQLLPRLHHRDQREGGRHAVRAFVYEHEHHVVRTARDVESARGEEGVSLPLAPHARDAIAGLFYARTLPLQPGDRYLVPINEAGRNLVVELVVAGRETVTIAGAARPALRLEPRLRRRAERRRPIEATIWVSDDEARVPLALDLDAPFGQVRLELVSYSP